jgi:hypothetical protein
VTLELANYANQWVAVAQQRVVACGETAQQALLAARFQRIKDEVSLIWVPPRQAPTQKPIQKNETVG